MAVKTNWARDDFYTAEDHLRILRNLFDFTVSGSLPAPDFPLTANAAMVFVSDAAAQVIPGEYEPATHYSAIQERYNQLAKNAGYVGFPAIRDNGGFWFNFEQLNQIEGICEAISSRTPLQRQMGSGVLGQTITGGGYIG